MQKMQGIFSDNTRLVNIFAAISSYLMPAKNSSLSIWEKETFFSEQDIVIVGSGFTGLWSAIKLHEKNPKAKITILERGIVPTGASTKNAGFSCFGSPSELLNDINVMGEEKTMKLVSLRFKGLKEIRKYFTDDEIGYDGSGGFECFAIDSKDWNNCNERLPWLNQKLQSITGEENTFSIVDEKISTLGLHNISHLIENKLEGGLHSGKLIVALQKKTQASGIQIITGVEVKSFTENKNTVTIETIQGIELSTKQLLLCTNAFTKQLLPAIDIIPNRGQVLVTSPIKDLKLIGSFHFERGYYYFRNVGNKILIGGARNIALDEESTTEMNTTDIIQKELESFISNHISTTEKYTITDRWSGIMGMGSEKLPIVNQLSNKTFCCVRLSGMGVALAPIVAEQIASLICKK